DNSECVHGAAVWDPTSVSWITAAGVYWFPQRDQLNTCQSARCVRINVICEIPSAADNSECVHGAAVWDPTSVSWITAAGVYWFPQRDQLNTCQSARRVRIDVIMTLKNNDAKLGILGLGFEGSRQSSGFLTHLFIEATERHRGSKGQLSTGWERVTEEEEEEEERDEVTREEREREK
ncbi:unnamed protein product, partial [Pleuronectes platessa]